MDDDELTAAEQAALDAQRSAPEPETEAPAQTPPETPQEGAEAPEAPEGVGQAEGRGDPPTVPYERFKEANDRRKELEREASEFRRKTEARFEELLKLVPQAAAAPTGPAAPALPDPQQDPAGYIIADMQQKGASIEQINQRVAAFEQQRQQEQVVAAVQQRAAAMETEYKAANPDYDGAMTFLKSFRDRQLMAAGMADPGQRAQQIQVEAFQIAVAALRAGGNPAERLHHMARETLEAARNGWKNPADEQMLNGQAPLAQAAAVVPSQADRLRMVQQGQEQSRGLGNVRGNGPAPMTPAKLLDMDDDTFLETMKKSKDARRLMGA